MICLNKWTGGLSQLKGFVICHSKVISGLSQLKGSMICYNKQTGGLSQLKGSMICHSRQTGGLSQLKGTIICHSTWTLKGKRPKGLDILYRKEWRMICHGKWNWWFVKGKDEFMTEHGSWILHTHSFIDIACSLDAYNNFQHWTKIRKLLKPRN